MTTSGRIVCDMQTRAHPPIRVVIAGPPDARRVFHDALASAGIRIVADCDSAPELLAAVARERPDVCVLDRGLRGGSLVATASIASPRRAPKVLVVGGRGSPAELRAARLAGAADSLEQDVGAAGLAAAVYALVRKEQPCALS